MIRKLRVLLFVLLLACSIISVYAESGGLNISFKEISEEYKKEDTLIYDYYCKYPFIEGDSPVAESINYYFVGAINEMTDLLLPMYAEDPDMAKSADNYIHQVYEICCNNGRFFSTRMLQEQKLDGIVKKSVYSQVFDVSGEYAGETLTLRGVLTEVGDSSEQIAALVLRDIWSKIEPEISKPNSPWHEDLCFETFSLDFYPEEHYYADEDSNAVFYLQPNIFRNDGEIVTFIYSRQDIENLIKEEETL
ncbi:MAG: hypothetical protein GX337_09050 [Christensenellaceae bacterium]|nr:hypothetical protein [Christensenellaceae bacterium]